MGARKANRAEKLKAEKKQKAIAVMRDCPTSPRKMRLVADIIRGVEINKALGILRYSKKEASIRMEKLLKSAIANWEERIGASGGHEALREGGIRGRRPHAEAHSGCSAGSRTPYPQAFEPCDDRSRQNGNRRKQVIRWDRKLIR